MTRPVEAKPPTILKPMKAMSWKYVNPFSLATSGIYTEKDLEALRDRIMFPVEIPSILNEVAREIKGHPITDNEGTIGRLLNENAVDKIIGSTWGKIWEQFMTFGTASAEFISILMILQDIKMLIGTLINGFVLHRMNGCSIHLLAAVWTSIAQLLVFLGKPNDKHKEEDIEVAQPLQELMIAMQPLSSQPAPQAQPLHPHNRSITHHIHLLQTPVCLQNQPQLSPASSTFRYRVTIT